MKDKGRVSGDGSHEGIGDGADNAGAKDDGDGVEAVLSEQEQPADKQNSLQRTEVGEDCGKNPS